MNVASRTASTAVQHLFGFPGGAPPRRIRWLETWLMVLAALVGVTRANAQTPATSGTPPGTSSAVPMTSGAAPATSGAAPSVSPGPAVVRVPQNFTPSRTLPVAGAPLAVPLPRARGGQPLQWKPQWSRFDTWDAIFTALAGASTITTGIVRPIRPVRQGGVGFDESVRNALRLGTYDQRGTAQDVSDVLLSLSVTAPYLVDSLTVAYWYRGSADVAGEMALIDTETFLAVAAVQGLFNTFTARERPYGRNCDTKQLPGDSLDCTSNDRYRSFFSGHSSLSFASASLVCSHHMTLHLFVDRTADIAACVTTYTAAAATATLRVVGDKHYASDVLTGSALGTIMGLAVPYFLHYRPSTRGVVGRHDDIEWHLVPTGAGGAVVGAF